MSWRTRWKVREYIRNSIWIVPALFAIAAIVAGSTFPDIDERAQTEIAVELRKAAPPRPLAACCPRSPAR